MKKSVQFQDKLRWQVSVAILLVGGMLLFWGGPDYTSARSLKCFWSLGHILLFWVASDLVLRWPVLSRRSRWQRWAFVLVATASLGIGIELLQYGTHRTPDMLDVIGGLAGSGLRLAFGDPAVKSRRYFWRRFWQAAAIAAVMTQIWPLARALTDEMIARRQFPLLSGFETPFEADRWTGSAERTVSRQQAAVGRAALMASLVTTRYSGVALHYFNGDWRGYRYFEARVYNPSSALLPITCRINDAEHDQGRQRYDNRYNRIFELKPGWNRLVVDLADVAAAPRQRTMDMSRIRGVGLFVTRLARPLVIFIDEVRLSRALPDGGQAPAISRSPASRR